MRGVKDYVIPKESSVYAAGGLYLRWLGGGSAIQLLGDKMLWVPKLNGSLVYDSSKGAGAWRGEIRRQDRLPHDQNAESGVRMAGKKLFDCGGPPQTCRSSGREQKNDAGFVRGGVKCTLKFAEARC